MFELKGKYTDAIVYADSLDSGAIGHIQSLLNQEVMSGNKVRLMADAHDGKGAVVGTTFTLSSDRVIPTIVGSDIGCGVFVVKLKEKRIDLPKLDSLIRKTVGKSSGKEHRYLKYINLEDLYCYKYINEAKVRQSLGTVGGGNHFVEVDKSEDETLYLLVHSGSRILGNQVAEYYQKKAHESTSDIDYYYSYVSDKLFNDYLHDMEIVMTFAQFNREAIVDTILSYMHLHEIDSFHTVHNYIDIKNRIVRKGAVSAKLGEKLIIPINMRDGSLICLGKGNSDYNYSAPHGAGRLMSRADAKSSLSVSEFKKEMKDAKIYTTSCDKSTIDESPAAYKSLDSIIDNIKETVNIIERIKPIYNFKSSVNN